MSCHVVDYGWPSCVDLLKDLRLWSPAENGKCEGRFRNKGVAAEQLEGLTGGVRFNLVIATDHPNFAMVFDTHLRRAEKVTCGMERKLHSVQVEVFCHKAVPRFVAQSNPQAQRRCPSWRSEIALRTGSGMVAMGMSNHGAVRQAARGRCRITERTIEPLFGELE